jgi:F-type H+-transporting ATPase subunit c
MKFLKALFLACAGLALTSTAALAQAPAVTMDFSSIGCGLVIIGAAIGIGWLTRSAVESMARQPEMAGNIQTAMIISAALIEGVSFFALIIIGFII